MLLLCAAVWVKQLCRVQLCGLSSTIVCCCGVLLYAVVHCTVVYPCCSVLCYCFVGNGVVTCARRVHD
jgi:hypothetical protein